MNVYKKTLAIISGLLVLNIITLILVCVPIKNNLVGNKYFIIPAVVLIIIVGIMINVLRGKIR